MAEQVSSTKKQLVWQAPEYPEYQKHPIWFVAFSLAIALLVLFGIYTESWSTAALFLLCGILGLIYGSQKPRTLTISLTPNGVQVNNLLYSYKTIKKFWIVYNPPEVKSLHLETSAYLDRIVKLELGDQNPLDVKNYLKQYLEEDLEEEESLADLIARKIRF